MERLPPIPWRVARLATAWLLIVAAAPIGVLPGPGGIFVFAIGAAMLLRNSRWAKRRYVVAARRWPRLGSTLDRVLRRPSQARRKQAASQACIDSRGGLA